MVRSVPKGGMPEPREVDDLDTLQGLTNKYADEPHATDVHAALYCAFSALCRYREALEAARDRSKK